MNDQTRTILEAALRTYNERVGAERDFVVGFEELVASRVRPGMEEICAALETEQHSCQILEGFTMPATGHVASERLDVTFIITPAGAIGYGEGCSPAPAIMFSGFPYDQRVRCSSNVSRQDASGGMTNDYGQFRLDELSRDVVAGVVVQFIEDVLSGKVGHV